MFDDRLNDEHHQVSLHGHEHVCRARESGEHAHFVRKVRQTEFSELLQEVVFVFVIALNFRLVSSIDRSVKLFIDGWLLDPLHEHLP